MRRRCSAISGPPPVSQIIIASLITTFATDVHVEPTRLKLSWLREALNLLNPADPLILPNVERILSTVRQKLGEAETSLGDSHPATPDLAMIMRMMNSRFRA